MRAGVDRKDVLLDQDAVYRYSRRDGHEHAPSVNPEMVMDAISDDLMTDGDLNGALQRTLRWGLQPLGGNDNAEPAPGLHALLQQLRDRRQTELERHDLHHMLQSIEERLHTVVEQERAGIGRRLHEMRESEAGQPGSNAAGPGATMDMLERIARKKLDHLNSLPPSPAGQMKALRDYEFMDPGARAGFDDILHSLQTHAMERHFAGIRQSIQDMTEQDVSELCAMLHDLNEELRKQVRGEAPAFERFMAEHGRHFPDAASMDDVVDVLQKRRRTTQSLLASMTAEMREQVQELVDAAFQNESLQNELQRLSVALDYLDGASGGPWGGTVGSMAPSYPFCGEEPVTLESAMQLMDGMARIDDLERALKRAQDAGTAEGLDAEAVRGVLGPEAASAVATLQRLTVALEEAGYIEGHDLGYELTARGIRRIGRSALQDIFARLKHDTFGAHVTPLPAAGSQASTTTYETKPYEFGDSFSIHLKNTLMNSMLRAGASSPLHLDREDFEVYRPEHLTQASTVLMLDMSRSMPLRGCFVAAKKVALALSSLIRTEYPRDNLYIIGFSDYAREIKAENLHQINWGDYVYGTNMQHGFMLARRLLARHQGTNKQVILITDGEPTAHFEGNHVHFSYPPTFRTFQETLREVRRCTGERIVINTFMLERSHYLADFVNQMTTINRGRAFFATPERLGEYILVDYVSTRRKVISR